jgi:hypothetical protein
MAFMDRFCVAIFQVSDTSLVAKFVAPVVEQIDGIIADCAGALVHKDDERMSAEHYPLNSALTSLKCP